MKLLAYKKDIQEACSKFLVESSGGTNGYCFLMIFEEEDKPVYHPRLKNPCYGELRAYSKDEDRPGDLFWPFPKEGTPSLLFIPCSWIKKWCPARKELFFNEETSPWRGVFAGRMEWIENEEHCGFLLTDADFDPTVMVQWIKQIKVQEGIRDFKFPHGVDVRVAVAGHLYQRGLDGYSGYAWPTGCFSMRRFITGTPKSITPEERTWGERGNYNRKDLHMIWAKTKEEDVEFYESLKEMRTNERYAAISAQGEVWLNTTQ